MAVNSSKKCCKVNLGIGAPTAEECADGCTDGGLCDMRIALCCAVLNTVETACPDKVITDFVMNTVANNPVDGDDDLVFYKWATDDDTFGHDFDWNCDEETDSAIYSETLNGEIVKRTGRVFCTLKDWLCKEVVVAGKEVCDNGNWIVSGIGGGLKVTQLTGSTGRERTDSRNTTFTITPDDDGLNRPFCIVDAGSPTNTTAIMDAVTSTAV